MNASRPEAKIEDSTSVRGRTVPAGLPTPVLSLAFAGALTLLVAQFTPLLRIVTVARHPVLVRSVQTGPHHDWALVPIAVLAIVIAALGRRLGARAVPVALGLLGLAALAVALLVDLRGVHATGIVGSPAGGLKTAQAHAGVGLYLETLGAALLLLAAAVAGALSPRARAPSARDLPARQSRRNTPPTDPSLN